MYSWTWTDKQCVVYSFRYCRSLWKEQKHKSIWSGPESTFHHSGRRILENWVLTLSACSDLREQHARQVDRSELVSRCVVLDQGSCKSTRFSWHGASNGIEEIYSSNFLGRPNVESSFYCMITCHIKISQCHSVAITEHLKIHKPGECIIKKMYKKFLIQKKPLHELLYIKVKRKQNVKYSNFPKISSQTQKGREPLEQGTCSGKN